MDPITRKRFRRFRQLKRGWWSLVVLVLLYLVTLGAELFCNSRPLVLRHGGRWYFPAFFFYPESSFVEGGSPQRADYLSLDWHGAFDGDLALWPIFRNDPYRIVPKEELQEHLRELVRVSIEPRVASLTLSHGLVISKATSLETLLAEGEKMPEETRGRTLEDFWTIPEGMEEALLSRWEGNADESRSFRLVPKEGSPFLKVNLSFAATNARSNGRKTLRTRALEIQPGNVGKPEKWTFRPDSDLPSGGGSRADAFGRLPEGVREAISEGRSAIHAEDSLGPWEHETSCDGRSYRISVEMESVRYPFRPVPGHVMGLDSAGRDVFARIFYGLRIALNFGMLLVFFSLAGGSFAGILQGYRGGRTDLLGQRFTEIWSALPFLYIMILMGSIYGAGFTLLLVCYALFNWIGIAQYMRAETLRLRRLPFVEAARCLGLSGWQIAFRHILPNALVPLITLFPFSLVGAIGSLAALDYLGFGLPVPTPSLGELLAQAQAERSAWWLTLFPSTALFIVMLLGVFVGEGIRNAFDPKRRLHYE